MISSFDPQIQKVIHDWEKGSGLYTFEIRIHPVVNPSSVKRTSPIVFMTFIIEVGGFFLDKEQNKPIKLHDEQTIGIERFNSDPQYARKLRQNLDLFSKAAYTQFDNILAAQPQPTYTSDPLHMK